MKIIYNNIIPFKGFKAINLFGITFVRKEYASIDFTTYNHERIHTAQMKELLYIPFYIIYFLEWLYRLFTSDHPYRSISFEREAYKYQSCVNYIYNRPRFNQWRKINVWDKLD